MNRFDVSVIMAVYETDIKRLFETLYSVLVQKELSFEVIIADDGSKDNHKDELICYFEKHGFKDYKLSLLENNLGTVKNFITACDLCEGWYIKAISPGDYLYDPYVLRDWVGFMDTNECAFSGGRYITYNPFSENRDALINSLNEGKKPYFLSFYFGEPDLKKIKYNYLLLDDFFMGAAILVKTEIFVKYLALLEDKVKYTEDAVFRMMISDGLFPGFFDRFTVWYSFGDGISTSRNIKWYNTVLYDHYRAGIVIRDALKRNNWFDTRYKLYLTLCRSTFVKIISKYVLFPSLLIDRFKRIGSDRGDVPEMIVSNLTDILDNYNA